MNYYEHHIGDYDKSTAHLTACEDGIYCRLLRRYYDTEAPIPLDLKVVQRLVRARSKDELAAVETVLGEFFTRTDEGWRHGRCDDEIARCQDKRTKAKRSASARWKDSEKDADAMRTHSEGSPTAMRSHSEGNALQTPNTKEKKAEPEPADAEPGPPVSRKAGGKATTIGTWVAACEAAGEECIPADDPIFRWAADAGIPLDFLALAWSVFVERHTESGKRQADWRATFRNAVRGNWYRLWWMDGQGTCSLTTVGQQVKRAGVAA